MVRAVGKGMFGLTPRAFGKATRRWARLAPAAGSLVLSDGTDRADYTRGFKNVAERLSVTERHLRRIIDADDPVFDSRVASAITRHDGQFTAHKMTLELLALKRASEIGERRAIRQRATRRKEGVFQSMEANEN